MTTVTINAQTQATQQIDAADLPGILDTRKGANFVSFRARVKETRVRKTAKIVCPSCNGSKTQTGVAKIIKCRACKGKGTAIKRHAWGEVSKISRVNGMINWKYEGAVQRKQEKHDVSPADFKSAGRQWGTRVHGTPFVEHTDVNGIDKQYVEVRILSILDDPRYFAEDGTEIDAKDLAPFLKERKEAQRQVDHGVPQEDVVICRDYGLDNLPDGWGIQKIAINGEVYDVR